MKTVPFGSLCSLRNGRAFKPEEWSDQGTPIVRIQNLNDESKPFNYCNFEVEEKFWVNSGDLLFSWSGTPGTSFGAFFWNRGRGFLNQHIFRVDTNEALVDKPYLRYALNSLIGKIIDQSHGGVGLKHITKAKLENVQVPLPPLPEQRRIAATLDKADALRVKRREAIAKLDQMLKSVFLEMFGDPVKNPKGWPVVSIQEACESIVDCVNRTAPTVDYVTDYKMIRTTNVRNFKVSLDSVRYVEKAVFDDWNRRLLPQKGDVILTREAPAGEAGVLDSDDHVFLGQRLMLYRVSQQRATPEYLLYALMGEGMQQQFKKQSSGSTVKHLSVPDCRSWDLILPPVELQKKFTEIATINWSLRQQALAHSNRLEELFSSIQKSAFSAGP